MSTKNDTNRGDCYPYTIQENKNEPFIISRACPPNCVEDKIKEALSARDKEWEEKIESFWNGNYGYYVIPVREWELLKSQMKEGK
jgi:hypothetical protein